MSQTTCPIVKHAHRGPATSTSRSDANVPTRGSNVPVRSQRSIGERTDILTRQLTTAMAAHSAANAAIVPAHNLYTRALKTANDSHVDEDGEQIAAMSPAEQAAFIKASKIILCKDTYKFSEYVSASLESRTCLYNQ
jgi:hypothetical protein